MIHFPNLLPMDDFPKIIFTFLNNILNIGFELCSANWPHTSVPECWILQFEICKFLWAVICDEFCDTLAVQYSNTYLFLGEKLLKPFWVSELLEPVVRRSVDICQTKACAYRHIYIYQYVRWYLIKYESLINQNQIRSPRQIRKILMISDQINDQLSMIFIRWILIFDLIWFWSDMIFINIYILISVFFDLRYIFIDLISLYHSNIIIDLKWSDIYLSSFILWLIYSDMMIMICERYMIFYLLSFWSYWYI